MNIFQLEIHLQSWVRRLPPIRIPVKFGGSYFVGGSYCFFPGTGKAAHQLLSLSLLETLQGWHGDLGNQLGSHLGGDFGDLGDLLGDLGDLGDLLGDCLLKLLLCCRQLLEPCLPSQQIPLIWKKNELDKLWKMWHFQWFCQTKRKGWAISNTPGAPSFLPPQSLDSNEILKFAEISSFLECHPQPRQQSFQL